MLPFTHQCQHTQLLHTSSCRRFPLPLRALPVHTLLLCAVCHSHSITPVFQYICKSHTSKHDSAQHLRRHSPSPSSLYTQHGNPGSNLVQVELMKLITGALISPHPHQARAQHHLAMLRLRCSTLALPICVTQHSDVCMFASLTQYSMPHGLRVS